MSNNSLQQTNQWSITRICNGSYPNQNFSWGCNTELVLFKEDFYLCAASTNDCFVVCPYCGKRNFFKRNTLPREVFELAINRFVNGEYKPK